MPFPPTFTDVWDITQPPDTQLANLLGQDLRNLKLDIMQRMSLLSGTTANQPTPETVNATWGGAGYGLLFFATDTGIIWQWNGAAWVNVTADFLPAPPPQYSKFTAAAALIATGNNAGPSIIIPANTLKAGSVIDIYYGVKTGNPLANTYAFDISAGPLGNFGSVVSVSSINQQADSHIHILINAGLSASVYIDGGIAGGGNSRFTNFIQSVAGPIVPANPLTLATFLNINVVGTDVVTLGPLDVMVYP